MITYFHCSSNNKADTVLAAFRSGVETYGLVWRHMGKESLVGSPR